MAGTGEGWERTGCASGEEDLALELEMCAEGGYVSSVREVMVVVVVVVAGRDVIEEPCSWEESYILAACRGPGGLS